MGGIDFSGKSPNIGRMIKYYTTGLHDVSHDGKRIGIAGDKLAAHHLWGDHVGTLNYDGRVWACSNKFNGVRLVTLEEFAGGKKVSNLGFVGTHSREQVLANYEALAGNGYNLISKNCEHIDNFVRGLGYYSRQLQVAGIALAGLFLVAAAKRA